MHGPSHHLHCAPQMAESELTHLDVLGHELFEACRSRFEPSVFDVTRDATHTVWVKRLDTSRSIGLSPWVLRDHRLDDVLLDVEAKLEQPLARR
jgi:hypothetical protein